MSYDPSQEYTLKMNTNGKTVYLGPKDMDISITDSIYRFSPVITLQIPDFYGLYTEGRFCLPGEKFIFTLGTKKKNIEYPFIFSEYETTSSLSSYSLSGNLKGRLIHEAKFCKKKISIYTKKSPSDVYKEIIKNAGIKSVLTSKSTTLDLVVDPFYDNEEFTDLLLKVAHKNATSIDPYFAFIDTENKGNFRSLSDMWNQTANINCVCGKISDVDEDIIPVSTFLPFSQDLTKIYPFLKENFSYFEDTKFTQNSDRSFTTEYSSVPVIDLDGGSISTSESIYTPTNLGIETAKLNYSHRKGYLIDKAIISIPMDFAVHAGCVINLTVYMNIGTETPAKANSYSGKYLIESSNHRWSKQDMRGYTDLVIGRPILSLKNRGLQKK